MNSKFNEAFDKIMGESMGAADYYKKNLMNAILYFVGKMEFSGSIDEFKQHIKSEFGIRGLELFSDQQLENMLNNSKD